MLAGRYCHHSYPECFSTALHIAYHQGKLIYSFEMCFVGLHSHKSLSFLYNKADYRVLMWEDILAALSGFYFFGPALCCQVMLLKLVSCFNSRIPFVPANALSSAIRVGKEGDFLEALRNT